MFCNISLKCLLSLPHPSPILTPTFNPPLLPLSSPSYHLLYHTFLPSLPILSFFHLKSHLLAYLHTPFVKSLFPPQIPLSLLVFAHRHFPYNHPHCLLNLLCLHLHCYLLFPHLNLIPLLSYLKTLLNQLQTLLPLPLFWFRGVEKFPSALMQSFSLFLLMVGDMIRMLFMRVAGMSSILSG